MKSRKRPSRTVLLGGQATRTHRSSAQAGLLGGSLAWGCGQARRTAWASRQKVASPSARPCPAPASSDASRARPSGNKTEPPIAELASAVKNKVRTCAETADRSAPVQRDLLSCPLISGKPEMSFMMRKSALSELSSPPISGLPEMGFLLRKSGTPDLRWGGGGGGGVCAIR